jgi:hypothetical protein
VEAWSLVRLGRFEVKARRVAHWPLLRPARRVVALVLEETIRAVVVGPRKGRSVWRWAHEMGSEADMVQTVEVRLVPVSLPPRC